MNLNPDAFNRFGARIGQSILWRKALECPCKDPDSGQPRADCRACRAGIIWQPAKNTTLALSGQKIQQAWVQTSGLAEKGDVVCSLLGNTPVYAMGEKDRVVFSDSSEPFSQPFQNAGEPLQLGFPVACIEVCFWLDPDNTRVIEGAIPQVLADGTLKFSGKQPPAATAFTIKGRRRPEFFCFFEFPQDRAHFHGLTLPRRVVLRNFNLYSRAF